MGSQTPTLLIPYPTGTDQVRSGDNDMQAIAERLETLLVPRIVDSGWVAVPAQSGYASSMQVRKVGTFVACRGTISPTSGNFTQGSSVAVATMPAAYRPPSNRAFVAATNWGGGMPAVKFEVRSDGTVAVSTNTGTTANTVQCEAAVYYTD